MEDSSYILEGLGIVYHVFVERMTFEANGMGCIWHCVCNGCSVALFWLHNVKVNVLYVTKKEIECSAL